MTVSNGMEMMRTIRADRRIEGVDPGIARATGQITSRFADTTLLAQAQNGTAAEFAFAYNATATRMMTAVLRNQQEAADYA